MFISVGFPFPINIHIVIPAAARLLPPNETKRKERLLCIDAAVLLGSLVASLLSQKPQETSGTLSKNRVLDQYDDIHSRVFSDEETPEIQDISVIGMPRPPITRFRHRNVFGWALSIFIPLIITLQL